MKRYAVLVGVSVKEDFRQKSLFKVYSFLKSSFGGSWLDKEILVIPDGLDKENLNFVLNRLAQFSLDFLFMYFCEKKTDFKTQNGFLLDNTEIKLKSLEGICKNQVVFFDSCEALIPEDDFYADDEKSRSCEDEAFYKKAEKILNEKCGFYFYSACKNEKNPVLTKEGEGTFTKGVLDSLYIEENMLNFEKAAKNGTVECVVWGKNE